MTITGFRRQNTCHCSPRSTYRRRAIPPPRACFLCTESDAPAEPALATAGRRVSEQLHSDPTHTAAPWKRWQALAIDADRLESPLRTHTKQPALKTPDAARIPPPSGSPGPAHRPPFGRRPASAAAAASTLRRSPLVRAIPSAHSQHCTPTVLTTHKRASPYAVPVMIPATHAIHTPNR